MKFHNAVVDALQNAPQPLIGDALFTAAYEIVVKHYQWIVLHDFLPRVIAGSDRNEAQRIITSVLGGPRHYTADMVPNGIPAEFTGAAYRFGHSMVRFNYLLKDDPERQVFNDQDASDDLHGHRPYPKDAIIAWQNFLDFNEALRPGEGRFPAPQSSMAMDTGLSFGLSMLPLFSFQDPTKPDPDAADPQKPGHHLAFRNLNRQIDFGLVTGQEAGRAYQLPDRAPWTVLGPTVLKDPNEMDPDKIEFEHGAVDQGLTDLFGSQTPLWYYILKEAQEDAHGRHLGRLGATIVTEVFHAILEATEPVSILTTDPDFQPTQGEWGCREDGEYLLVDLIRFANGQ